MGCSPMSLWLEQWDTACQPRAYPVSTCKEGTRVCLQSSFLFLVSEAGGEAALRVLDTE